MNLIRTLLSEFELQKKMTLNKVAYINTNLNYSLRKLP